MGHPEGGWTFAGVDHPEAAAGACPQVKQPSSLSHARDQGFNQPGQRRQGRFHGRLDIVVHLVHGVQEFMNVHVVEVVERTRLFRGGQWVGV